MGKLAGIVIILGILSVLQPSLANYISCNSDYFCQFVCSWVFEGTLGYNLPNYQGCCVSDSGVGPEGTCRCCSFPQTYIPGMDGPVSCSDITAHGCPSCTCVTPEMNPGRCDDVVVTGGWKAKNSTENEIQKW